MCNGHTGNEKKTTKEWIFVIDTDKYAGNFEREITAYITGVIGECGVGDKLAALFLEENPDMINPDYSKESILTEYISQKPDEHGCRRPCTVWSTPGWFNSGAGQFWREDDYDDVEVTEALLATNTKYEEKFGREITEEMLQKWRDWTKHSAYLSVGIFFYKKPPPELLEFLMKRAKKFVTERPPCTFWDYRGKDDVLAIENFRFLEKQTTIVMTEQFLGGNQKKREPHE